MKIRCVDAAARSFLTLFLVAAMGSLSAVAYGASIEEKVDAKEALFETGFSIPAFLGNVRRGPGTFVGRALPVSGPGYSGIVKKILPTAVLIKINNKAKTGAIVNPAMNDIGSGVIISPDGYIVTNNHVVEGAKSGTGASAIEVTLLDGRKYRALLVGTDPACDIAVVKVNAVGLPFARWGNVADVDVGDEVIAAGNPLGENFSATFGHISGKNRRDIEMYLYENYLQTDAAINPGNSGGGLFRTDGGLIGINTIIAVNSGGNAGIALAIPADIARAAAENLIAGKRVSRGYIGVQAQELTEDLARYFGAPSAQGALVSDIDEASPGAMAGLQRGDIIVEVNGLKVLNEADFRFFVVGTPAGKVVRLALIRDGKEMTVAVTTDESPRTVRDERRRLLPPEIIEFDPVPGAKKTRAGEL